MYRIIAFILFSSLLMPLHASSENVLQQIKVCMNDEPVIRGNFEQIRELQGVPQVLKSEGYFVIDRTVGVLWQTIKPFTHTTRITHGEITQKDGETTLFSLTAQKEPTIAAVSNVLFSIFSGDIVALTQYFEYTGTVEKNGWILTFTPKNIALKKIIHELSISGNTHVQFIKLTAASGDISTIRFFQTRTDATLTADEKVQFEQ